MKRRILSRREANLWSRVTRDVAPISKSATPTIDAPCDGPESAIAGKAAAGADHLAAPPTRGRAARQATPKTPALGAGDPAFDRRAARRKLPIDATIDLHGMTAAAAARAFRHFVFDLHIRGARAGLVITGKGAPDDGSGRRRGVLRAALPAWADDPEIRPLVARLAPAAPKDGGAGAFYVFLKKKNAGR